MKETVILKSPDQFSQVLKYLDDIPSDELHCVVIKPFTESISVRQQGYYFGVVIKSISEYTGTDKDELHRQYKKQFMIDIMCSNPDDYPGFGEMLESLREVYRTGKHGHANRFYEHVIDKASIMDLKRPHKAELIDRVIRHAAEFMSFSVPPAEPDILRR